MKLNQNNELQCPHCSFDHNHMLRVGTELGTLDRAEEYQSVQIEIQCESCGIKWMLLFEQHKGRIAVSYANNQTKGQGRENCFVLK